MQTGLERVFNAIFASTTVSTLTYLRVFM